MGGRQTHGFSLEKAVKEGCALYHRQGIALIEQVPTPIRRVGSEAGGTVFRAVYAESAHVDFFGVFLTSKGSLAGEAIAIECKATTTDRLYATAVREKQKLWLDSTKHAFVVVWFAESNTCRLVPWRSFGTSVDKKDGFGVDATRFLQPLVQEFGL